MNRNIEIEKRSGVVRIALNRPESLNALNTALVRELTDTLGEAENDATIKCVILTGNGRAFSAGMDLKAVDTEGADMFEIGVSSFDRVANLKLPVIGAVKGYVITGGMELALSCDLVIAADNTMFRDTHMRVGIMPFGGNSQRLPRLIGEKKAKELLYTSRFMPAAEAEALGLVNRVVPLQQLDEEAWAMAAAIAEAPRDVIIEMKALVNEGMGMDFRAAMLYERFKGLSVIRSSAAAGLSKTGQKVIQRGSGEVN